MIKILFIIGSGSFIGGISRFMLSRYIQNSISSSFPYGTFAVNIIGCFLAGLILGIAGRGNLISPEWRMFLTIGFCGGFTTFSTFATENTALIKDGNIMLFAIYAGLTVFIGILSVYAGNIIIKTV